MTKQIETDSKTFVKFWMVPLFILLIIFFIINALTGLVIIGISIFMALALRPLVNKVNGLFTKCFGKDKKHQTVSAVFAYLIVMLVIIAIVAIVGPVVVNETSRFIQNFPETFESAFGGWDGINKLGQNFGVQDLHSEIDHALMDLSNNLMGVFGNNLMSSVSGIADVVMKAALVLVLTLLFLLEGPGLIDMFWNSLGAKEDRKGVKEYRRLFSRMADVVSTYVSRQLFVAILDGCATMIIVFLLSLFMGFSPNLAIPMGMITMLFYMIPMFGQFIGGSIVTLILLASNWAAAVIFIVVYVVYSQIENNIIAPKIQGDALKLQPVIILCAVIIGMYMFGLLGAIISIPIAGCIRVLLEELPNLRAIKE
ncbi:AI-2E family transporter [Candidatus Saccharibacteria bacterium]|nr:AI-2E family transporter [Candidatus Saccharibacteria bacterium]